MPSPIHSAPADHTATDCPDYRRWCDGYGVIEHNETTRHQVRLLAEHLVVAGHQPDAATVYRRLADLDRLTSAGLWLVVHMTYARRVDVSGQPLAPRISKPIRKATLAVH